MAQHVACALIPRSAALASRLMIPEKSGFRAEKRSVGAPKLSLHQREAYFCVRIVRIVRAEILPRRLCDLATTQAADDEQGVADDRRTVAVDGRATQSSAPNHCNCTHTPTACPRRMMRTQKPPLI